MSSKSTRKSRSRKAAPNPAKWPVGRPKKPYPDYPLTPHVSGKWMKKIRGTIHYFGAWARRVDGRLVRVENDGWEAALALYKGQADDLHAGRTPRDNGDGLTVADLCNRFLTAKQRKLDAREIGSRMFGEYKATTDRLVRTFGGKRLVDDLAADDFEKLRAELAEQFGPVRLSNEVGRIKSVFKYAADNGLLERPVRFGSEFKKPGKAVLRKHKAGNGGSMIEADELRKAIDAAGVPLKAMVLLGVNCGFGNHDVATLPKSALDLDGGWIDFPRPKTGIGRRCWLWPETVQALKAAIAERPEPRNVADAGVVFLMSTGRRWVRNTEKSRTDNVSVCFGELLAELKLHRPGLNFYALRHTFRTVADAARDPVAIDRIMGHADHTMGGHYRERIDDSRLQAVAELVRQWLFGVEPDGTTTKPEQPNLQTTEQPQHEASAERPRLRLYAAG